MSISQKSAHQSHEAIVFFSGGSIGKEMLYTEFEALLDCVVPMREFAGQEMRAAYVRLDSALAVVAAVLFLVPFDEDGFPEQRWNVPLRLLADSASRGPDLGGGPAKLATRSQCPVAGQEQSLWDVEYSREGNTLDQLRERLHGNRLGLDAPDLQALAPAGGMWGQQAPPQAWAQPPQAPAWPTQQQTWQQPPGPTPSAPAEDASMAAMAVMRQANQQITSLNDQHQRELMVMQERMVEMQQRMGELQHQSQSLENERRMLQSRVDESERLIEDEQRRSERKVQLVLEKARAQMTALRQELQDERDTTFAEKDRQLAEAIAERDSQLQDELGRIERERQVNEELLAGMRIELTDLRRDKLRLMEGGADKFFAALKEKGVKFVAFQPGAGHLTIPMEDLYRYIEETTKFVADKCGVSEEQYLRWLTHYNNPVCQGSAGHGGQCAKPLTKQLKPAEFIAGMHDRCDIHKQVPRSSTLRDASA